MLFNEKIGLAFMLAGHSKNVVDESFGHVTRRLKTTDARTPRKIMNVVESSSTSNCHVPSVCVAMKLWKPFLENYFRISAGFTITKYHIFRFDSDNPETFLKSTHSLRRRTGVT